jgi:hypothetical protein
MCFRPETHRDLRKRSYMSAYEDAHPVTECSNFICTNEIRRLLIALYEGSLKDSRDNWNDYVEGLEV